MVISGDVCELVADLTVYHSNQTVQQICILVV